jgi:hypothetical protein
MTDFKTNVPELTGQNVILTDLVDVFHPLEGVNMAQTTKLLTSLSGDMVDLNTLFEPISSGGEITFDTEFKTSGTDLRKIFAGNGTVEPPPAPVPDVYPPMTPGEDPPPGVRPPLLNRVEMTGEGGYMALSYMYQNIDTLYMIKEATQMIGDGNDKSSQVPDGSGGYVSMRQNEQAIYDIKKSQVPSERWGPDLKLTRDDDHTVTFATIPNCIRMATGNHNSCVMFRDGAVVTGGGTWYGDHIGSGSYQYSWLADNWQNIVDMFMPTSYIKGVLPQVAIMRDNTLIGIDLSSPSVMANPKLLLTDLKRIRAVNQGHSGDMICETNDGSLYWIHGYGLMSLFSDGGPREWKCEKMNLGVSGDEIAFMSLGDYSGCCRVVLKENMRQTRIIHPTRILNALPTIPHGLHGKENFDSDLLDITSNELCFTYARENEVGLHSYYTNKGYTNDTSKWGDHIRAVGSTAYAVIHKYTSGYYVGIAPWLIPAELEAVQMQFQQSKNMTALEKYIIDNA